MFALTRKTIFDGVAQSQLYLLSSQLFTKNYQKPVAIHLKVCENQACKVTSAVQRIIILSKFYSIYNSYIYLSLVYDFNQGGY